MRRTHHHDKKASRKVQTHILLGYEASHQVPLRRFITKVRGMWGVSHTAGPIVEPSRFWTFNWIFAECKGVPSLFEIPVPQTLNRAAHETPLTLVYIYIILNTAHPLRLNIRYQTLHIWWTHFVFGVGCVYHMYEGVKCTYTLNVARAIKSGATPKPQTLKREPLESRPT